MLEAIITWSLRRRWVVIACMVGLTILGVWCLRRLNVDAFPDTTPVQVQINTVAPALVPEEVERMITFPIELAMGGIPGLIEIRSDSQFGLSAVYLIFEDGTDIWRARQIVNERLFSVQVPPGTERPEMGPVATGLGEVFQYALVIDDPARQDATTLRTTQDWVLKPELLAVPGTAEVNSWGGFEKQYQVRIDPQQLLKFDLSLQEVIRAVRANNLNVGGGYIVQGDDMLLVQGVGRTTDVSAIENIVITSAEGVPIRVKDVAEVSIGHTIRRGMITANGRGEAVLGLGFMRMGENSYAVTKRQKAKLLEAKESLPPGMHAEIMYDRTELVDDVIATVRANLLNGAVLVVLILFVLLGNLRAGLIAAAAIPFSMLFAFCGMYRWEIAATLLSLGAIDFGIVVDSSVVVLESIVRDLSHHPEASGRNRLELVREAAVKVRTPAVFGQLIIMIVYIPILMLEGVEGKMFRPMAITVILVLAGSLIASLTVTPVLASLLLPRRIAEREALLVRILKWPYTLVLPIAFRMRMAILSLALFSLVVGVVMAMGLGTEFVPRLAEGSIAIGVVRPPGTSLEYSERVNTQMEAALLEEFPDEISHLWSRQGAPAVATDVGRIEDTDIFIELTPREQWTKAETQEELVVLMEDVVARFRGQKTWFTQPIEMRLNEMITGFRGDVAIKLFGEDFDKIVATAEELEEVLRSTPGSADVHTEQLAGQPLLRIRIDQEQIARYGIPAETVLEIVEAVSGKDVGQVIEGQLRFPLAARLPEDLRNSPEALSQILLAAPSGERIPLSRVAVVEEIRGARRITREERARMITIQCNVRGRDLGSFVSEAQRRIEEEVEIPDGCRAVWDGQFENMKNAQRQLAYLVPLALALIVVLLYLSYRNLLDAAFLFTSVPFACVGGVIALWIRDLPISISAAVGFITLSGVSVLNSMVWVSALREQLKTGLPMRRAVEEASYLTMRTIIMTALVASVGFLPMATSTGVGAEVQRPLATVVIGGVIASTFMSHLILPLLFSLRRSREPDYSI
jgi:cobalt-zinc-cadmium resistance protein CzcA